MTIAGNLWFISQKKNKFPTDDAMIREKLIILKTAYKQYFTLQIRNMNRI